MPGLRVFNQAGAHKQSGQSAQELHPYGLFSGIWMRLSKRQILGVKRRGMRRVCRGYLWQWCMRSRGNGRELPGGLRSRCSDNRLCRGRQAYRLGERTFMLSGVGAARAYLRKNRLWRRYLRYRRDCLELSKRLRMQKERRFLLFQYRVRAKGRFIWRPILGFYWRLPS